MTPTNIQNYRIVRELGAGAMGAVYEGVDTLVERPVAIKMLRAEIAKQPELIERFRGEAVALGRLIHPNIALLYNFFRDGEDYYMVMEFVSGQSLENIILQAGRLELTDAAHIMGQALDGIGYAHSMGILHRDVKPANILVTGDGRVKVTDFGIARVLGSSRMTRSGRIIGTLEYIAPERIKGDESDKRSDLYSAGIVLYEMLTGKLPFTGTTDYELIKAQLEQEPPTLSAALQCAVPEEWENVVHRALSKDPNARFADAQEFRDALPLVAAPRAAQKSISAVVANATRVTENAYVTAQTSAAPEPAYQGPAEVPTPMASAPPVPMQPVGTTPAKKPAGLWIAIAAAVVLVLVLAGIGIARMLNPTPAQPAVTNTTTTPQQTAAPQPEPPPEPKPDESWKNNNGAITIGSGTQRAPEQTPPAASGSTKRPLTAKEKRDQALRALGEDPNNPNAPKTKRNDALRALDH